MSNEKDGYSRQNTFLHGLIKTEDTERDYTKDWTNPESSKRSKTFIYHLFSYTGMQRGIPKSAWCHKEEFELQGDVCTGFLLGGIGEVNTKRQKNFFVVTKAYYKMEQYVGIMQPSLPVTISNESVLPDYIRMLHDTTITEIEERFNAFIDRADIAIILITQKVAEEIRHVLDNYDRAIPSVLEIPSKDHPYDSSKDSILKRAKGMFSAEDFR